MYHLEGTRRQARIASGIEWRGIAAYAVFICISNDAHGRQTSGEARLCACGGCRGHCATNCHQPVVACGAAQVRVARLKAGALARGGGGGGGGWLGGAAALLEPEPQGAWCACCQTWAAAQSRRRGFRRQRPFRQPSVPCPAPAPAQASVGARGGELRRGRAA
jgi:hypothetical protein